MGSAAAVAWSKARALRRCGGALLRGSGVAQDSGVGAWERRRGTVALRAVRKMVRMQCCGARVVKSARAYKIRSRRRGAAVIWWPPMD